MSSHFEVKGVAVKTYNKTGFGQDDIEKMKAYAESYRLLPPHKNLVRLLFYEFVVDESKNEWQLRTFSEHCEYILSQEIAAPRGLIEISDRTFVKIATQIASGLSHVHKHGLLHGSVSYDNVYFTKRVDSDAEFKLAEGEAVVFNQYQPSGYTGDQNLGRYIRYLSPLAITKGCRSQESDIWAFGVFVWVLCSCGMIPYGEIRDEMRVTGKVAYENIRLDTQKMNAGLARVTNSCFSDSAVRPSFTQIVDQLKEIKI